MNSTSRSVESYESSASFDSSVIPGVRFTIARMSFARRLDLTRRVREVAQKIEFLDAGGDTREQIESSVLSAEIDRMYLEWGLLELDGLTIDGDAATPALLIEKGPETLAREIVERIRGECHLAEDERKN